MFATVKAKESRINLERKEFLYNRLFSLGHSLRDVEIDDICYIHLTGYPIETWEVAVRAWFMNFQRAPRTVKEILNYFNLATEQIAKEKAEAEVTV